MPSRACGPCTLCCTLLAVPELHKPPDTRCVHEQDGGGCAIYDARPATCRAFVCRWQQGTLREALRPDLVHVVVSGMIRDGHLAVFEDPAHDVDTPALLEPEVVATCEAGKIVAIVRGIRRQVIGTPEALVDVARSA